MKDQAAGVLAAFFAPDSPFRPDPEAGGIREQLVLRAAVGVVETRAFEDDAHRVKHLPQAAVTHRALRQRLIGELLYDLEVVPAVGAYIFVGGHGRPLERRAGLALTGPDC